MNWRTEERLTRILCASGHFRRNAEDFSRATVVIPALSRRIYDRKYFSLLGKFILTLKLVQIAKDHQLHVQNC